MVGVGVFGVFVMGLVTLGVGLRVVGFFVVGVGVVTLGVGLRVVGLFVLVGEGASVGLIVEQLVPSIVAIR